MARPRREVQLPDDVAADADVDPVSAARTICLRLLTVRARTRSELQQALSRRDVPAEAADFVLSRLSEVGLVDDVAFAEQFVLARQAERGLAARELQRQLSTKGVTAEVARSATAHIDAKSEGDTARALVQRKLRSMRDLEPQVQTRRLVGMLARKGYSAGLAYSVVREAVQLGDDHEVPDDFEAAGPDRA